jgi:putative effector of murein hydrolase LrgA (UPF0299 family)
MIFLHAGLRLTDGKVDPIKLECNQEILTLSILFVAVCTGIVASTGFYPAEKPSAFVQSFSSGPALMG